MRVAGGNFAPGSLRSVREPLGLFASFSAAVSEWPWVALRPVTITGLSESSSRPVKPRSASAPRPAARRWAVILLWRAVVISLERPERAVEIHSRLPRSSVMARKSRPWALCLPL
jgi:hypothetical protein